MAELFLELFGEEIPARMQVAAEARLRDAVTTGLKDLGLGGGQVTSWSVRAGRYARSNPECVTARTAFPSSLR